MQAGNAEHFYADTGSFFWPAFATHLKGSQVRTHAAPDLSEASRKKKLRVARKRGKLLRRWGSVMMGQVSPNVKMNVKM